MKDNTEHIEQVLFFAWASAHLYSRYPETKYLLFAIPNGGHRHIAVARSMKAEGVKRGVPDIFLALPRGHYHGLFIELKRTRGGRLTPHQRDFMDIAVRNDYMCAVCHGCAEAQQTIIDYLAET